MQLGIGLFVVIASILIGYTMHHGHIAVLLQWAEFVILGGCAVGACIVGNTGPVIKGASHVCSGFSSPTPSCRRCTPTC